MTTSVEAPPSFSFVHHTTRMILSAITWMTTWNPSGMALSSPGLLSTYRGAKEWKGGEKKEQWRVPPEDFVAPGSRPRLIEKRK